MNFPWQVSPDDLMGAHNIGKIGELAIASIFLIWHETISPLEELQNLTACCQEKNIALIIESKTSTHHVLWGTILTTIKRRRSDGASRH